MSVLVGRHHSASPRMNIFLGLLKSHVVLIVALAAAAVTCFFVTPDAAYADYFDLDTLSCLFCTLAVVSALKERRFFEWLAGKIVTAFGNMRRVAFALVFVTYFGSMVMANDMALVTFLPLGFYVLSSCGKKEYTAFVFVMQNVAANLGGMLTPFGNPQNLYLYSYYSIAAGEFFKIMALPFAVAFLLIAVTCLFVKPVHVELETPETAAPPAWRMIVYFVLFALSVLIVFRVFPFYVGLIVVTVALLILEPKAFLHVDYALLLTFCAFFVFSGNLARIPAVEQTLGSLVALSPLLPGHQQRPLRRPALPLHHGLPTPPRRGQHRRARHPRLIARKPHHPRRIPQTRARQNGQIPRPLLPRQFPLPRRSHRRELPQRPHPVTALVS